LNTIHINGNELQLLPEKGIFWTEESALVLSDVHIGKSAHFRRNGGNHDILSEKKYMQAGIEVIDSFRKNGLRWEHEHVDDDSDEFQISGHVHPGIRLKGGAKQTLVLPCFYFSKKKALMPAFGEFTGLAVIKPKKEDRIWVVAENKLTEISLNT